MEKHTTLNHTPWLLELVPIFSRIASEKIIQTLLRRFFELRDNKQISSDTLIELAEIVLKSNIFEFDEKSFKQVRRTEVGIKFTPLYVILFMADLEEKLLNAFGEKPMIWGRYKDIFLFGKSLWKNFSIN